MATRGRIGIKQKSGRIIASYQHWDSYPGGLGYNLINHWEDPKRVTEAIKLGDSSKWGYWIGTPHDFDKHRFQSESDHMNCYYMRDRGEKDCGYKVYKDEEEYIKKGFNSGEEYIYLLKDVGDKDFLGKPCMTWYFVGRHYVKQADGEYKDIKDPFFRPLEEVAIKEHIEILQRHLELKKERKVA